MQGITLRYAGLEALLHATSATVKLRSQDD